MELPELLDKIIYAGKFVGVLKVVPLGKGERDGPQVYIQPEYDEMKHRNHEQRGYKKVPLCEYHRKVMGEKGKAVGRGGVGVVVSLGALIKTGGQYINEHPEVVKEVGKKVATVIKKIPKV